MSDPVEAIRFEKFEGDKRLVCTVKVWEDGSAGLDEENCSQFFEWADDCRGLATKAAAALGYCRVSDPESSS